MPSLERNRSRSAAPSLRGYRYQILFTVKKWLELRRGEFLYCEGNEDLDAHLCASNINLVEETQIKYRTKSISENSPEIVEAIENFIVAFAYHLLADQKCRLVFRSFGPLRNPRGRPVLTPWLRDGQVGGKEPKRVLERWLTSRWKKARDTKKKQPARREQVKVAITKISELGGWNQFFQSVVWAFSEPSLSEYVDQVTSVLRDDVRAVGLDAARIVSALERRILLLSTGSDYASRRTDAWHLNEVLDDIRLEDASGLAGTFGDSVESSYSHVYVSYHEVDDGDCVLVALLVDDVKRLEAAYSRLRRHLAKVPTRRIERGNFDDIVATDRGHTFLETAGFDVYASRNTKGRIRRKEARFRRGIGDIVPQLYCRPPAPRHFGCQEPWQIGLLQAYLERQQPCLSTTVSLTANSSVGMLIARKVSSAIMSKFRAEPEDGDVLRTVNCRIRSVFDHERRMYFTQDRPLYAAII